MASYLLAKYKQAAFTTSEICASYHSLREEWDVPHWRSALAVPYATNILRMCFISPPCLSLYCVHIIYWKTSYLFPFQEVFRQMRDQYIETGDGFLLVYSINDRGSTISLTAVREQILHAKGQKDKVIAEIPLVLVGNKVRNKSCVSDTEA